MVSTVVPNCSASARRVGNASPGRSRPLLISSLSRVSISSIKFFTRFPSKTASCFRVYHTLPTHTQTRPESWSHPGRVSPLSLPLANDHIPSHSGLRLVPLSHQPLPGGPDKSEIHPELPREVWLHCLVERLRIDERRSPEVPGPFSEREIEMMLLHLAEAGLRCHAAQPMGKVGINPRDLRALPDPITHLLCDRPGWHD